MQIRWIRWIRWLVVSTKDYSLHLLAHVQPVQSVQSCLLWKINMDQLLQFTVLICADLYCLALHWSLHIFALRAHISTLQDSSRGLLIYTFYTSRADSSVSWQWLVLRLSHLLKVTQESCSVRWCSNQNPFLNNLHSDCASFLHLYSSSACTSDYSRPVAGALKSILCMYNYIFIYICFQVLFLGQASYSLSAFVFTLTGLSLLSLGQEQVLVILFMFSYMFIHVHTFSCLSTHSACQSFGMPTASSIDASSSLSKKPSSFLSVSLHRKIRKE